MTIGTRVREVMSAHIEAGDVPGAVWEVSGPDGIDRGWAGTFAPDGEGPPVGPDTVFRLSSTTKPIIAALAMTLVDDGTLSLDQPVDEVLPELANRRVMVDPNGSLTDTVPAERPITVADVLEFRLGIGMDFTAPWPNPIMTAAEAAGLAMGPPAPQSNPEPDEWMRRLGTLPLVYQPGEKWLYHTGASVLGVLIARAAAQPLADVLSERLLTPLGMTATGFGVPAQQRGKLGPLWMPAAEGEGAQVMDPADGQWASPPAFPDAGDGLVSTVGDVAAFAAMLRDGGTAGGQRVLSAEAVRAMTTSRVGLLDPEGSGWGLGMGVRERDEPGGRHAGSYGWDGGLGTSWWTDPVSGVTAILFTNQSWTSPQPPPVFTDFWAAAFGG
jgi:CubicO group peptidase (beta-lactamase class C family)